MRSPPGETIIPFAFIFDPPLLDAVSPPKLGPNRRLENAAF
jgi:hypothetical protein